jgi:hypothetical protein
MNIKNKKGAMEMTVGTIVTIVLLMSALVLGLILTKTIFTKTTENIGTIDDQVKGEIKNLFAEDNTNLVVGLGGQNSATVKQGTDNFGIPFGFSPTNPQIWGVNKDGCKYNIEVVNQANYCINKGWTNVENSIITGITNVKFDQVDSTNGYALIKISVPADVSPCLQRFSIVVKCAADTKETTTGYFDLEIIKKGLF